MPADVICPSGFSGQIRGLKIREQDVLANRKLARSGAAMDHVFSNCWLNTSDVGPYKFQEKPNFSQVLQGDRVHLAIQLRIVTYGNAFLFKYPCEADGCGQKFDWEIELDKLPVTPYPKETLELFQAGQLFEATLPSSKKKVKFKLLTGIDEQNVRKIKSDSPDKLMSALMRLRIKEIQDVPPATLQQFIQEMDYADAQALRDQWDEFDGGVETGFEVECHHCQTLQEVDLPMDASFFSISAKRKKTTVGS